jgi:N-acetylglucosaminyldiphosphoundecaprenol N-acetyl-beta-D-mannosaminyltransferase
MFSINGYFSLYGIKIENLTINELLEIIAEKINSKEKAIILTPNVDDFVKMRRNIELYNTFSNAHIKITDGHGIIYAANFLGYKFKETIGGRRFLYKTCDVAKDKNWKILLFGSQPGVAIKARENLLKRFKNVQIVGAISPSMNFINDVEENMQHVQVINSLKPDIIFVGLGTPKGKLWISKYFDMLNATIFMEIGGSFDVVSGLRKTPPVWMSDVGLEWFFRMINSSDPKYWKRCLIEDPVFFWWILKLKFTNYFLNH